MYVCDLIGSERLKSNRNSLYTIGVHMFQFLFRIDTLPYTVCVKHHFGIIEFG